MDLDTLGVGKWSVLGIIGGLLFSTFGVYFIKLGRKDANIHHLGIGLVLLVFPMLVQNVALLWALGTFLLFLGYRFRT